MAKKWTKAEDAKLAELWPDTHREECSRILGRSSSSLYARAHFLGLKRSKEYTLSHNSGRFKKGDKPHNAGLKGWQPGGKAKKTQFKRGHGNSNNRHPIGHEKIDAYGTLLRKVSDIGTRRQKWRPVKDLVYEQSHGNIPNGKIVTHDDFDKDNFEPKNLVALTRADIMRRNSFVNNYPPEYRGLKIQLGWLNKKIKDAENE